MRSLFKRNLAGFSLIELMISIAVLGLGLALALPSYRQWIQNTQIRNASESIQNGMQRARSEAVSRNVSAAFILGNGVFWTVRDISTNQTIETRAAGEISQYVSMNISPAPPPGFAIPTTTITFNSLGAVIANADGSPSITQIDIDSTALSAADSRELRITVGIGGIIRMCDPNPSIATTDPRHC